MNYLGLNDLIKRALQEDVCYGDITTLSLIPAEQMAKGVFYAKTPGITSDHRLDTPFFTVPSSEHPVAVLFMQRRDFAAGNVCSDGGVLEYSEDDGATWKALPRQHLKLNPYNGTIPTGVYNPLANRQAWCYQQDWERTVVDMKAFAGKSIAFRFRLGTGRVDATDGWYVDDFSLQTCVEKPSEDPEYKNYVPLIFNND